MLVTGSIQVCALANSFIAHTNLAVVRFQHGVPKAVFTSRHSFGSSAYSYDAMEKIGKRVCFGLPGPLLVNC